MHRLLMSLVVLLGFPVVGMAQYKMSNQEYIETYKELAIRNRKNFGVPACITLAQGMLESGNGGSRLAVEGNNHFGIKCKGSWTGEKIYHDDDQKGECFRKYKTAEHSYNDHSKFLKESQRYAFLFDLKVTDYKGWAHGLKKAGYATNPKYPELLIGIIERNNLHELDRESSGSGGLLERIGKNKHSKEESALTQVFQHAIQQNNGVKYIVTVEGDSFASIAHTYGLSIKKLIKLNDLQGPFPIPAGTTIYLEPKRAKSQSRVEHVVVAGDSYHSISQQYGIKLKNLQKLNPAIKRNPPRIGQSIRLK